MKPRIGLSFDRANELLSYEKETGILRWKKQRNHLARAGDEAGGLDDLGYKRLMVDNQHWQQHRVVWLLQTGALPLSIIDHIDGDRANNKFANLRLTTAMLNAQNKKKARVDSQTGIIGVRKQKNRWSASISINKHKKHLGSFLTQEEAANAYLYAKRKHHLSCTI
jgi:hypothetical protein